MKFEIQIALLMSLLVAGCGGSGSSQAPINAAPPTISSIPNQSTSANVASSAIVFSVSSATSLSFNTSSDNQQVVPDSGLDLVSYGASGSITVTPIIDTLGDAFITIIVTNQAGLSANTSFLLTILPEQAPMQQFVRTEFAQAQDGEPALVNAIAFNQDAENDDFADLLAQ